MVIDASWKKSKKILFLNPALQSLPRIGLTDLATSQYQIRSTSQTDGVSTIEAIYYALSELEDQPVNDLLLPFLTMVSRQQAEAAKNRDSN